MKGLGYFEKLSLAAHWFLPREEAEGMMEDYRDILFEVEGPEEAKKRFGPPVKLVLGLAEPKKVRRWHMLVVLMLFCLFAPLFVWEFDNFFRSTYLFGVMRWYNPFGHSNLGANFISAWLVFFLGIEILDAGSYKQPLRTVLLIGLIWMSFLFFCCLTDGIVNLFFEMSLSNVRPVCRNFEYHNYFIDSFAEEPVLLLIEALTSFVAFGFGGKWKKPLSKPLLFSLIGAFVLVVVPGAFLLYSAHVNVYPLAYHLEWVDWGTAFLFVVLVLGGLASLALARMWDPRWRSVLILCMAGLVVCYYLYGIGSTQQTDGMLNAFYLAERHKVWLEEVDKLVYPCIGFSTVLAAIGLI